MLSSGKEIFTEMLLEKNQREAEVYLFIQNIGFVKSRRCGLLAKLAQVASFLIFFKEKFFYCLIQYLLLFFSKLKM